MYSRKRGFTLVEVLVASTIGAFIALVSVGTLRAMLASAEMVDNNINTAAELRFASRTIARDLLNLYRDGNVQNTKLIGTVIESEQNDISCVKLYTVGRIKARTQQPEGDVYEVEYFLLQDKETSVLYRRLWPNPDQDENAEPGGVLTVIAENIVFFNIRYFDGQEWQNEWPEEMETLPQLMEVNIVAQQPGQKEMAMESFLVNFARFPARQASAPEGSEGERGGERSGAETPPMGR